MVTNLFKLCDVCSHPMRHMVVTHEMQEKYRASITTEVVLSDYMPFCGECLVRLMTGHLIVGKEEDPWR